MNDTAEPRDREAVLIEALLRQRNEELTQRKRETRWKNLRILLIVLVILGSIGAYLFLLARVSGWSAGPLGDYAAMVKLKGLIADDRPANALAINGALRKAFEDEDARGIVLLINSPGGSPVQSAMINRRIRALMTEYPERKLVVVATDVLASGAYLVAVAAPKIYADPATITGSIGVVADGFGFVGLIDKLGVERRSYTAGEHKRRLDPFAPEQPEDVAKIRRLLDEVHAQFIGIVRAGRGDRLKGAPEQLFSGDFWTGETALELGLVDGLADLSTVLETEFGVDRLRDYTPRPGLLEQLTGGLVRAGAEQLRWQAETAERPTLR